MLTAILAALIGETLEKKLRKVMPNALDLIMTPFIVMLVTFLVVILGIGPIMHTIELGLVNIVEALVNLPLGIGGFLIGATYPLLVITGLHHTYTMIETSLLANTGFNPVITLCAMYGFANVGFHRATIAICPTALMGIVFQNTNALNAVTGFLQPGIYDTTP